LICEAEEISVMAGSIQILSGHADKSSGETRMITAASLV
jgi:hypothetical protein